jgi:hypothetical protein
MYQSLRLKLEVPTSGVPNLDLVDDEPLLEDEQIATTAPAPVTEEAVMEDEDTTAEAATSIRIRHFLDNGSNAQPMRLFCWRSFVCL